MQQCFDYQIKLRPDNMLICCKYLIWNVAI
jgi:hypothetical protein